MLQFQTAGSHDNKTGTALNMLENPVLLTCDANRDMFLRKFMNEFGWGVICAQHVAVRKMRRQQLCNDTAGK